MLDAAMLVAEGDFEVDDLFTGALEPKVAGFDDAGMNGADRHLVYLATLHPEEFIHDWSSAGGPADGLQPGVPLRHKVVLLP
jgi:hypothetical protein